MKATCRAAEALGGCTTQRRDICKSGYTSYDFHVREMAYGACATARESYQKKCHNPKGTGWAGHMQAINKMRGVANKCGRCARSAIEQEDPETEDR